MNPLRVSTLLPASLLLAFLVNTPGVHGQVKKQPTAIEKLADLLGGALKAATGREEKKPARRAVVRDMAQPAMDAAKIPEDEVKNRLERLTAWSGTMQEWISRNSDCTDEQKKQISEAAVKAIESAQRTWKQQPRAAQRNNRALSDYFPIKFTNVNGASRAADLTRYQQKIADAGLSDEQRSRLTDAVKERTQFQQDASLGYILNLLDAELFLTSQQRETMARTMRSRITLDAACYSFQPQNYYFQQTSLVPLVQGGNHLDELNAAQKLRAADLASIGRSGSYNIEQYILFQSQDGVDTWSEKLDEAITEQKSRLRRAINVRVSFQEASHGLSESQTHHLEVAGKGAVDDLMEQWKKTTRKQLKSYEDQMGRFNGGNFAFAVSVPDVHKLERDEVWTHAVEALTPDSSDTLAERNEARSHATAMFVVAMLDRELWLDKSQREQMLELVRKNLPSPDYQIPNRNYFGEVTLLSIPLFRLSKQDVALFSAAQMKAWETVKKQLNFDGSMVRVHMKNGGEMSFQVPGARQKNVRGGGGVGFF